MQDQKDIVKKRENKARTKSKESNKLKNEINAAVSPMLGHNGLSISPQLLPLGNVGSLISG